MTGYFPLGASRGRTQNGVPALGWIQEDAEMSPVMTQIQEGRHGAPLVLWFQGHGCPAGSGYNRPPVAVGSRRPRTPGVAGGHAEVFQDASNTGLQAIRAHGPSLSRGSAASSSCSIGPCLSFPYCKAGMSVPMDFSCGLIEVGFAKHGARAPAAG